MKLSDTKHNPKKIDSKINLQSDERHVLFAKRVLTWYKKYGRHDLVWRHNITAYSILVSEIMLQQTQVSRVLPKYTLWMKKYKTLSKLANAPLQEILVLWQGLGYQRRAKALLAIAKSTKQLPTTEKELLTLPGIGTYTATAILAFAYNTFGFMLETNIRTVLIDEFHTKKSTVPDTLLKKDLDTLMKLPSVKKVGARIWYWALMDYGAHLKVNGISHNARTESYTKQTSYKNSFRKVRAEVLFAITHNEALSQDERVPAVLKELHTEGFITGSTRSGWSIA